MGRKPKMVISRRDAMKGVVGVASLAGLRRGEPHE